MKTNITTPTPTTEPPVEKYHEGSLGPIYMCRPRKHVISGPQSSGMGGAIMVVIIIIIIIIIIITIIMIVSLLLLLSLSLSLFLQLPFEPSSYRSPSGGRSFPTARRNEAEAGYY